VALHRPQTSASFVLTSGCRPMPTRERCRRSAIHDTLGDARLQFQDAYNSRTLGASGPFLVGSTGTNGHTRCRSLLGVGKQLPDLIVRLAVLRA
jgi:hypothetical protein